jgi:SAM-dependent methyltransferase
VLRRLLARVAAHPKAYDLIQAVAGDDVLQKKIAECLRELPVRSRLVDLGGGTGLAARSARADMFYICVDVDAGKLRRFVTQRGGARAVVGDATRCPMRAAAADAVMVLKLTHHLDQAQLAAMMSEAARIMRPGGLLVLADAVKADRLASRLLWKLDRGAYARRSDAIQQAAASSFAPIRVEEFSVPFRHRFLLWVGSRPGAV